MEKNKRQRQERNTQKRGELLSQMWTVKSSLTSLSVHKGMSLNGRSLKDMSMLCRET